MNTIFIYLVCINAITFIVYGIDKLKAIKGRWRIPESELLSLAFVGGAPGALLGMVFFRHKTRKMKFRIGVPLMLILEVIAVIYIFT